MKLLSLPRWAKLSITISVVILLMVVGFRGCGSKKSVPKSDTLPPVTTTTPTLQRIESAITVIQNGLADLTKGLANLNSRVEILEKRLTPRVTSEISKKTTAPAVPPVSKSPPPTPSTTAMAPATTVPLPAATVDLTPVERELREGLGGIAEAIKETRPTLSASTPPVIPPVSDNPCANWVQNPTGYRRCRLWNQLP